MRRKQTAAAERRTGAGRREPGTTAPGPTNDAFTPFGEPDGSASAATADILEGGPPPRRLDFLRPRNWRVPTRLTAILLIPVVIGLVFGGLQVRASVETWQNADHAERTARLARAATTLADALESERDLTAVPLLAGHDPGHVVSRSRAATDRAMRMYDRRLRAVSGDPDVASRAAAFQAVRVWIPDLRANAYSAKLAPTATQLAYSVLLAPLMAFDNEVGLGYTKVNSRGRSMYALSLTKAAASTQRVLMEQLMAETGRLSPSDVAYLVESLAVSAKLEEVSLQEFTSGALPRDLDLYRQALEDQARAEGRTAARSGRPVPSVPDLLQVALAASRSPGGQSPVRAARAAARLGLTPASWDRAAGAHIATLRTVEKRLNDQAVSDAHAIKTDAERDALLNAAVVVAALALAGLLTGFIARSMIRGMRTLRTTALDIAGHRLPEVVDRLSKADPGRIDTTVAPIPLHGRDEIGEVARAFDEVHRQAVRLAAEQALLRGNVNAIFTNLSRRSQGLIQRQLQLITGLENNEADPDQLESLFKLDHLATRMRRNGENLLVLAGEEPGRRWNQPVPLVDVLRAAASEVEQYERIELAGIPASEVVGAAVTDLVHLLAELLENATTFSSPQTRVRVTAVRLPDGRVLVEIHDRGIGLTAEDFAEINEKLARPPTVDASVSRRMGLFVVGRLAGRHGIRVQLRPSGESTGTTSLVMLPVQLVRGRPVTPPEERFTVSRATAGLGQAADRDDGPHTAAELGFDESRYERPEAGSGRGFSSALESLQRSRRRRAELWGGAGPSSRRGDRGPYDTPPQQYGAWRHGPGGGGAGGADQWVAPPGGYGAVPGAQAPRPALGPGTQHHGGGQDYGGTPAYGARHGGQVTPDPNRPGNTTPRPALGPGTQHHDDGQGHGGGQDYGGTPAYGGGTYRAQDHGGEWYDGPDDTDRPYPGAGYRPGGRTGGDRPDAQYPRIENPGTPGAWELGRGGVRDPHGPGRPTGRYGSGTPGGGHAAPGTPPREDTGDDGPGSAWYPTAQEAEERAGSALGTPPSGESEIEPYGAPYAPYGGRQWQRVGDQQGGAPDPGVVEPWRPDPQAADTGRPDWFAGAREEAPSGTVARPGPGETTEVGWNRAQRVGTPETGGVTPSGLPRRVPRQNLVPGGARPGTRRRAEISRAPEEIRSRLSSLRRGVERGRSESGGSGGTGGDRGDGAGRQGR